MLGFIPLFSAASKPFSTNSRMLVNTARIEFPKPAIALFSLKKAAADIFLVTEFSDTFVTSST